MTYHALHIWYLRLSPPPLAHTPPPPAPLQRRRFPSQLRPRESRDGCYFPPFCAAKRLLHPCGMSDSESDCSVDSSSRASNASDASVNGEDVELWERSCADTESGSDDEDNVSDSPIEQVNPDELYHNVSVQQQPAPDPSSSPMASPSAQPATPGKRAPSSSAMPQFPYHPFPLPEALRTTAFFSLGRHPDEISPPDLPPSASQDAAAASSDAAAAPFCSCRWMLDS
eukprot:5257625-Pleurochrysis_carterae.AAC.1